MKKPKFQPAWRIRIEKRKTLEQELALLKIKVEWARTMAILSLPS